MVRTSSTRFVTERRNVSSWRANAVGVVLLDCHVDPKTKGGERRTDLVVELTSESNPLLCHGAVGDRAKQQDVVVGKGDGTQCRFDHPARRLEVGAVLRPQGEVSEVAVGQLHRKDQPVRRRARIAATGHNHGSPLIIQHHLAGGVGNRERQVSQRRLADGHGVEFRSSGEVREAGQCAVGSLEALQAYRGHRRGFLEGVAARLLLDQDAATLGKGNGHEKVEEGDLEDLALDDLLLEGGDHEDQPHAGQHSSFDADPEPQKGAGVERWCGEEQQVGTVDAAGQCHRDQPDDDTGDARSTLRCSRPPSNAAATVA